ncbi:EF-hand domain-containing protein [Roseinatronobacter sp.]|uniref:EF-hand domain-containing protein n=1 Tax=Roseinatronobacter sp. TaxID=1945755 RepID=UPI0025FC6784|nr:EF-hand domain-containing protein [Roseibaca sp.]
MKKTLISALALTIALGAGAATARGMQDHGPRAMPSFEDLDRDGNGQVTLEDLQTFGEAQRAEMDAKRAERMTERAERMGERGQRMFDRVDANDDGIVDAEEYAAFTDRMAERMEKRGKRGWGRH